jgi:hypothetical protein
LRKFIIIAALAIVGCSSQLHCVTPAAAPARITGRIECLVSLDVFGDRARLVNLSSLAQAKAQADAHQLIQCYWRHANELLQVKSNLYRRY